MKTLAWIVGGAVIVAVSAWFAMAFATERVVAAWLGDRASDGWVVHYSAIDTGGFPARFDTEISTLDLADPETGWAWSAPVFQLGHAALRPDHVRVDWPATQTLASPHERLTIEATEIWADLDVQPTNRFALDASTTVMRAVDITSNLGGRMALERGDLQVTRVPGQEAEYDIRFEATGMTPPADVTALLDPAGLLPDTADIARYEARMRFDRPWDLSAIEVARPQILALSLTEMRAQWGQLLFRASGELTVDETGRATGEIAVRAENWRDMLEIGSRAGAISPGMRSAAERALGFVAGLSGRPEDIDATLRLDEGFVFFGPLPIGEAPRLILR